MRLAQLLLYEAPPHSFRRTKEESCGGNDRGNGSSPTHRRRTRWPGRVAQPSSSLADSRSVRAGITNILGFCELRGDPIRYSSSQRPEPEDPGLTLASAIGVLLFDQVRAPPKHTGDSRARGVHIVRGFLVLKVLLNRHIPIYLGRLLWIRTRRRVGGLFG